LIVARKPGSSGLGFQLISEDVQRLTAHCPHRSLHCNWEKAHALEFVTNPVRGQVAVEALDSSAKARLLRLGPDPTAPLHKVFCQLASDFFRWGLNEERVTRRRSGFKSTRPNQLHSPINEACNVLSPVDEEDAARSDLAAFFAGEPKTSPEPELAGPSRR